MLPEPLHPMVVHFPVVLAVLLPVVAGVALLLIRRGGSATRGWAIPVAFAAALALSAFVAVRTGEADEERVEAVVDEAVIHTHEEAAEQFLLFSGVLALIAAAGLVRGTVGAAARMLTFAGSLVVLVAGVRTGSAGGDLVYRHNAASVYAESSDQVVRLDEEDRHE